MPAFSKDLLVAVVATLLGLVQALEFIVGLDDTYAVLGEPLWWTCSARREKVQEHLSYRWQFKGAPINPAPFGILDYGNGTIFISEVKYLNLGLYTCAASNGQDNVESQAWLRQSYTSNRVDIKASGQSVSLGSNTSILCQFDAQPAADFLWLFNGREIRNAVHDVDISLEQKQSTLQIGSATYAHSGEYRCQLQHKLLLEPLQSQPIKIDVFGKPWMAYPLIPQKVPLGYNATLRCLVYGVPQPDVVWTFTPSSTSHQPLTLKPSPPANSSATLRSSTIEVDGNGVSLNIIKAESATDGQYACQWSNSHGSITHNTSLAVSSSPPESPVITQSPKNNTVAVEGQDVEINCSGTGIPTPTVEWLLPSGDRVVQYPFKTESSLNDIVVTSSGSLVIRNLQRRHAGQHKCVLINTEGNSSTTTFVDVLFKPYLTESPGSVTVDERSKVEIRCQMQGNPHPSIDWSPPWINNVADKQSGLISSSGFFQQNGSSLIIESISQNHQGAYSCQATNSVGTLQGNAFITVRGPPVIVEAPSSVGAVESERIELRCQVSGFPVPTTTWHFLSLPDPSVEAIDMVSVMQYAYSDKGNWTGEPMINLSVTPKEGLVIGDISLVIPLARATDGGLYLCTAKNSNGQRKAAAILRVVTFPRFDKKPEDNKLLPGDTVLLDCLTSGIPVPSQRWLFNNRKISTESRFTSYDNGSLAITSILDGDFGSYTCLATNGYGQRSATAKLLMSSKPYLITKPRNSTFVEFQEGIIECGGKSTSTFSTSWFLKDLAEGRDVLIGTISNGEAVVGLESSKDNKVYASRIKIEDNGSLKFSCVEMKDEASYYCQVHNEDGLTKSDVVTVNVNSIPRDIDIAMPSNSEAGDNVQVECDVQSLLPISISWISPKATEINASSSSFPGVVLHGVVSTNGISKSILKISDLTNENHGGDWWCKVCNTIGCSLAKSTLLIKDRPVISAFVASASVNEISFQCIAVGIPAADISFLSNGSKVIETSVGHRVIENTLIVQRTHIQKEYLCEAENSLGSSKISLSKPRTMIINRVIPYEDRITIETVADFPLVHLLPTSVFVEYKADADGQWKTSEQNIDSDLKSYLDVFNSVQWKNPNISCSDINAYSAGILSTDNTKLSVVSDGQNVTYSFRLNINSLLPYTSYSIRTFMENYISSGTSSSTEQVVTLAAAPPPVENIEITVFNRSAWISWSNPNHINGRIEDVFIQVDVSQESNSSTVRRKTAAATEDTSLTFSGLAISNYDVEITSINQRLNRSSEIVSKTFIVEKEVPNFVPEIVQLKSVAFYHVLITWTIPPEVDRIIPPVTGYSVVLSPKTEQNSDIVVEVDSANTSSLMLKNLQEREEYYVRIASKNTEGVGLYSARQTFITAYAPFSTLPLGTADLDGTSWKLIAIGIVSAMVPIGLFAVIVAINVQIKLKRRGSAEITTESIDGRSTHDDPTSPDLEGALNSNFMLF